VETVYVPATEGMTPAQVRNMQTFLNAVAADHGWDGKFIVLPPGAVPEAV
jgi:hypothetical protein